MSAAQGLTDAWTAYCKSRGFGGFVYARPHDEYLAFSAGYAAGQVSASVPRGMIEALRFYGGGHHMWGSAVPADFDTVSGEPNNWWFGDECPEWGVEDGTIAKMALAGKPIDWDGDEPPQLKLETTAAPAASPPAGAATIATLETRLREVAAERTQAEARIADLIGDRDSWEDQADSRVKDCIREMDRAETAESACNALTAAQRQAVALLRDSIAVIEAAKKLRTFCNGPVWSADTRVFDLTLLAYERNARASAKASDGEGT